MGSPIPTNRAFPLLRRRELLLGGASLLTAPLIDPRRAAAQAALGVVEVAPGLFVHKGRYEEFSPENAGDVSNPAFIVGRESVAVIDTGGSPVVGQGLLAAIRGMTPLPIRYVINTHMHPDHVFGNVVFRPQKPEFVGHHKLPRALEARRGRYLASNRINLGEAAFAGTEIILPTRLVETSLDLDLGDRVIRLTAQKTAHTDNDLTVRDLATDTLILSDLLFAERVPSIDGSIRGWIAFLEQEMATPAARVVPGHGPAAMPWPAAAMPLKRYLDAIAADVRAMIDAGRTMTDAMATAAQSEKGAWALASQYHARNISAAFGELEWEL
ncbi:MAG: quinoprotein relay system zinc metallohydrolase 2 [Hyphomicrobium sp.]